MHTEVKRSAPKRLELLDVVRFCAVLMVLLFHYTFNGIANGKITSIGQVGGLVEITKYGYLGVELFFMISGYVIFFSAQSGSASKFAVSRAVRLYPAYWFAVLFTAFVAGFWGGDLMAVTPPMVVVNLTMLQSFVGVADVDGAYWTLAYEIRFYFAVFLVLLMGWQRNLRTIFLCWPILFVIALFLGQGHRPYAGGYYCYFCAGALFAILRDRFDWRVVASLLITFFLCVNFSAGKAVELTAAKGSLYSGLVIAILVAMFFVLFAIQNMKVLQQTSLPYSKALGALTYPIYLVHAHFGYIAINHFASDQNKFLVIPLLIAVVISIAYALHRLVEIRLAEFWRRAFALTVGRMVDVVQEKLKSALLQR